MSVPPDRLERFAGLARDIVGSERVMSDPASRALHSYDASLERGTPDLVVAPADRNQFRAVIASAHRCGVPYVPRGAGTGYSGGAIPAAGGVVVLTAGLARILATDFDAGWIRCEPGVVLAKVQSLAAEHGWRYVPDPSSHQVCTVGGNLAENAGGPHALGGGSTLTYVQSVELVEADGSVTVFDEQQVWDGALDLCSLMSGAEGTLGAVCGLTLRLVRAPEDEKVVLATFGDRAAALATVTRVFELGMLPSAMDMLTGGFIPGRADFTDPTLLFVSLAGFRPEVAEQASVFDACVREHGGRVEVLELAEFLPRRAELVRQKVRRMVAASTKPRYYLFDATAPRSRLTELMGVIHAAAEQFDLPVLNTFHAGDGNVHPTPFYDPRTSGIDATLRLFSETVLRECAAMGGALTGEHGIGLEKKTLMPLFFPQTTLQAMRAVKRIFDPAGLSNPGKVLPDTQPDKSTTARVPQARPAPVVVNLVDAWVEINDPSVAFTDVAAQLAGTPYELRYEPLGGDPGDSVTGAIDTGRPGLREPRPLRARDMLLGVDIGALRLGGAVTKDVAGYDLRRLAYGGHGRLGPLRRARLRLLPKVSDSRLVTLEPIDLADAATVIRTLHQAGLPWAHLGIVVDADGAVTVTGRLELHGGRLDDHAAIARARDRRIRCGPCDPGGIWTDPPMLVCGPGAATGGPAVPWDARELFEQLRAARVPSYFSVGHRRAWWAGQTSTVPHSARSGLVAAALRGVR